MAFLSLAAIVLSCGGRKEEVLSRDIEALGLPSVHYRLGNVRYDSLFETTILPGASDQLLAVYKEIRDCKTLFTGGEGSTALSRSCALLADALSLGHSPAERLMQAEALHLLARCFFYQRGEKLEPATSLLERAIMVSGSLIHHSDTTIQQVALFQFAQHHDVMQGLTGRYSNYWQHLDADQRTFASRTALYIKTELLGLKGAPVLRSASNLSLDQNGLCQAGFKQGCDHYLNTARRGIRELPWLSTSEMEEYQEFIAAVTINVWGYYREHQLKDSMEFLLEQLVRNVTGRHAYRLRDPIASIGSIQGRAHFAESLPRRFLDYANATGDTTVLATARLLRDSLAAFSNRKYTLAMLSHQRSLKDMADLQGALTLAFNPELQFPVTGSRAYDLVLELLKEPDMQDRQQIVDMELGRHDPGFKALLDSLRTLEEHQARLEFHIGRLLNPDVLRRLSVIQEDTRELSARVNQYRLGHMLHPRYRSLTELRSALRPNEVWVAVRESGDRTFLGICSKEKFVLDYWANDPTGGPRTRAARMNVLMAGLVNAGAWGANEEETLEELSREVLGSYLPPTTEHVILCVSDRHRLIMDLLATVGNDGALRSVRFDPVFHMNEGRNMAEGPKDIRFFGVAPVFGSSASEASMANNTDIQALIKRMKGEQGSVFRDLLGPLEHNVSEVKDISALLHGKVLVENDVSEHVLMAQLPAQGTILHLATHAILDNNDVDRSGVVLAQDFTDDPTISNDNVWRVGEIRASRLNASLVVLSACGTSTTPTFDVGFDYSIASAFRDAGCANIISSLWKVEDRSTHDIMIEFYRQLQLGKGKAEALFEAKRIFRERNPDKGPRYWAPLVLTGDDEAMFTR